MGFKSFMQKAVAFVRHASVKVSEIFIGLFGKEKAAAFAHSALALLSTKFGQLITSEVAKVESVLPAIDGKTKLAQVVAAVFVKAPKEAASAGNSLINLLVELAVAEMAGHFSPDTDGDGIPDFLDSDDDNDGVADKEDAFPKDASKK